MYDSENFHIAMCLRVLRDALVPQVEKIISRYCKRKGFGYRLEQLNF